MKTLEQIEMRLHERARLLRETLPESHRRILHDEGELLRAQLEDWRRLLRSQLLNENQRRSWADTVRLTLNTE